jgi:hypothetical protein
MRKVPRAAELVREVATSSDEELLEDHDIVEVQEPPQITILHKRNIAWANYETCEKTKAILQLYVFDV